jgi:hypothetical protein
MSLRITILSLAILTTLHIRLQAQVSDSLYMLLAVVYDESYVPVPATHVINMNSHQGDVTDTLGIFRLQVLSTDTLLIRNIAFHDTLVPVAHFRKNLPIRIKRRRYQLQEARIFTWGASYDDFRNALLNMEDQQSLGATLGLPQQDPGKVPLEMDEKAIKSAGLLLTSPISFFYYNFSKHAKSARKVYWLEKNETKQKHFDAIVGIESLTQITGLEGNSLLQFRAYLFSHMDCNFNCSELKLYEEIHSLWSLYQVLDERGMLENQ